jgi:Domain of unknown function (DUF4332)
MHIIRLDIDRKNSAEHLQVGPLGSGLNAIYAVVPSGIDTLARFVRGLLFRSFAPTDANHDEFNEMTDGSLQWVDASGHIRMMSYAGGASQMPTRFVHSPLHPSERPIHAEDRTYVRGLGNTFGEGDEQDGRWDDLRSDILGMIFCSPLGSVPPEKLWWAASRLGVHASARSEVDEGYQRLKAEERDLLDRLRHVENVDHDRAWWSIERDRLAAELTCMQQVNTQNVIPVQVQSDSLAVVALRERLVSIQIEISKLRSDLQELGIHEANTKLDGYRREDHRMNFSNMSSHPSNYGSPRNASSRVDFSGDRQRLQLKIEHLLAEQASVEIQLRNAPPSAVAISEPVKRWDDSQLRQQHANAEEMLKRWDRRAQSNRRLAEVQSHLRTRSPYRRTMDGSLIPAVEKFLRELTSGAARQLPTWAVEASYLNPHDPFRDASDVANEVNQPEHLDRSVPAASTRQRKLVDLAIRLAIAEASVNRIGRIPLLLDDSIKNFRGESLEQILHVLATFARDGRQLLVSTSDEYTARRIGAHGGTVSRMQEIMRYARPNFILDGQVDAGLHPSLEQAAFHEPTQEVRPFRVIGIDSPSVGISELNRQLSGLANEQASHSWWHPEHAPQQHQPQFIEPPVASENKRYYLSVDRPVHEAPGVDTELLRRFHSIGINRVGDLLRAPATKLGNAIRVDTHVLEHLQQVADLMCGTPQLRAFDAQVLVGCGISRASALREMPASALVHRVESFMISTAGQDLVQSASPYEVSRIQGWLANVKRSLGRSSRTSDNQANSPERRDREQAVRNEPRQSHDGQIRPRIARTAELDHEPDNSIARQTTGRSSQPRSTPTQVRSATTRSASPSKSALNSQWKFYLDIDSPVVDAPSIGPRMAERLLPLNVNSVGDLIASDAKDIAAHLADRNVNAEHVEQWQQQALLVCRIPNLRGHDAQLLVGSGFETAEQVAAADASVLFEKVVRFANSKAGVRILRGSAAPDLTEVSDWIQWSQNCRAIRAA